MDNLLNAHLTFSGFKFTTVFEKKVLSTPDYGLYFPFIILFYYKYLMYFPEFSLKYLPSTCEVYLLYITVK